MVLGKCSSSLWDLSCASPSIPSFHLSHLIVYEATGLDHEGFGVRCHQYAVDTQLSLPLSPDPGPEV